MFERSKEARVGRSGGRNQLDHWKYTPLYGKGIKKIENKPMKTTKT